MLQRASVHINVSILLRLFYWLYRTWWQRGAIEEHRNVTYTVEALVDYYVMCGQ